LETADVLIVDDDSDLRRALSLLLEKTYTVAQAADGKEALRFLEKQRPSLVLLDITMPGMSGIEVLGAARALDKALRIVMVTSHQEIELAKRALDLGAIAYVTKPFDAEFIRAEIARLLAPQEEKRDGGRPWRVVE
jgi:DNA-binding NtrC family response regulator